MDEAVDTDSILHVSSPCITNTQNDRQRILDVLSQQEQEISCMEVSKLTGIPPKTCNARLNELHKDLIVDRPLRGYYALKNNSSSIKEPTGFLDTGCFGGVVLPRIQNLRMGVDLPVGVGDGVVCDYGCVKVELRFGVCNNHLDCTVSCDLGLDPVSLSLVIARINELCYDRGYVDLDWRVSSFEWLSDFYGLRLDGLSCVTLRDFMGDFSKVYQKPWGVRRESRWSDGEVSLSGVWELLRGDVQAYNYRVEIERLANEVKALVEAQKYTNRGLGEVRRLLEGSR